MNLITCPDNLIKTITPSIFLGGGITNCPDWQTDICNLLQNVNVDLVNPRRTNFDVTNPNMSKEQIEWEFNYLHKTDYVLFYFPKETLCPITLYELGYHAAKGTKLFVAVHPEYQRKFDIIHQLRLARPGVIVHNSLENMVLEIKSVLSIY